VMPTRSRSYVTNCTAAPGTIFRQFTPMPAKKARPPSCGAAGNGDAGWQGGAGGLGGGVRKGSDWTSTTLHPGKPGPSPPHARPHRTAPWPACCARSPRRCGSRAAACRLRRSSACAAAPCPAGKTASAPPRPPPRPPPSWRRGTTTAPCWPCRWAGGAAGEGGRGEQVQVYRGRAG
jgi:hypothetical protein